MSTRPIVSILLRRARRFAPLLLGAAILFFIIGRVAYRLCERPDVESLYRTGRAAMAREDLPAVQVVVESLADLPGIPPYASLLQGFIHLRSGRLREAAAELALAREHPATSGLAKTLAGEVLFRSRQFDDAIAVLSEAVEQDPTLTDAHRRLAAIYYDIGATEPAVAELRTVSRQALNDPRPHRIMGLIFKDMEAYDAAIREYREALRRDPNLPERNEVLVELANCLAKEMRHAEFDEIIAKCPRSAETLALRADSRRNAGDAETAQKLVAEALQLEPNHLDAMLTQGNLLLAAGKTAEAAEILKRAAEQHPVDYRVRHVLGQALARLGQTEAAQKQTEEADRLRKLRARFAELHGKAAADTRNADIRYELGTVANELNRPDLAVSWFAAALALNPNHAAARAALKLAPEKDKPDTGKPDAGRK